jgi:hypothetical protein
MRILATVIASASVVVGIAPAAARAPALRGDCEVTVPTLMTAPPVRPRPPYYGTSALFTVLARGGVTVAQADDVRADGSIAVKYPWWKGSGGYGTLRISGRRLDGDGPPVRGIVPSGYGRSFQASAIVFGGEGCWRVVARSGARGRVAFTTRVVISR